MSSSEKIGHWMLAVSMLSELLSGTRVPLLVHFQKHVCVDVLKNA